MPFKSKAQQRLFYAKMNEGEIPEKTVKKWTKETKKQPGGFKDLPEHVEKEASYTMRDKMIDHPPVKTASTSVGDRLRMKYLTTDEQKYNLQMQTKTAYGNPYGVPAGVWQMQQMQKLKNAEARDRYRRALLEAGAQMKGISSNDIPDVDGISNKIAPLVAKNKGLKSASVPNPAGIGRDLRDVMKGLSIGTGVSIAGYQTNRMLDTKRENREMQQFQNMMQQSAKVKPVVKKEKLKPEPGEVFTADEF